MFSLKYIFTYIKAFSICRKLFSVDTAYIILFIIATLYDRAKLSRFEVRFTAKDIKGNLDGKNGVYELLNCVIKVLQCYKVDVSGKGINFMDCKITNWGLLNTYNK